MNFYRVNMSYDDEAMEDGIAWDYEIVVHEEKYSNKEFKDICNQAMEICRKEFDEVILYGMVTVLKRDFGFMEFEISEFFDFHEEYL